MKTIYTFTMKDNNSFANYASKLRLLAYMLYDSIYNYYGEGKFPLNINENIIYNKINEDSRDRTIYKFDSELCGEEDNYYYEPFLIGNNSFGFTIIEDDFDINIIKRLLKENLTLLNLDCQIDISTFVYEASELSDETNREMAIGAIMEKYGIKQKKPNWFEMLIGYGKQNRSSQRR